jgi:energy-coupling factor transporter ATP-binding protein EcfA2
MAAEEALLFTDAQRERLNALRAQSEEEETEEGLEQLRIGEQDLEAAQGFQRLLQESGFAQGQRLTYGQMAQLLALARSVCPNPNLDARLLRQPEGLERLNEDLHLLLYGTHSLPIRLRLFLQRERAGAQTALQLLCLSDPKTYPLLTRAVWERLELSPAQEVAALALAREHHFKEEKEESLPDRDPVLRILAQSVVMQALSELLEARDYLHLYRTLSINPLSTRRRRAFHYLSPPALLSSPSRLHEPREIRYHTARQEPSPPQPTPEGNHREILASIEGYAEERGYHFAPHLLRNYYIALQTKPFCLLAGVSGAGKTLLTHLFAKVMTGNTEGQYLLLPVRPDWTDSSPLLGYVNYLAGGRGGQGQYVSTPFLEYLLEAGLPANRYRALFLCLDEMNLARIEHYGAELLSAMEMPEQGLLLPDGSRVPLPPNLFLCGTLNLDEATHSLSRKVLDRANTLLFEDFPLVGGEFPTMPSSLLTPSAQETFLLHRVTHVTEAKERLDRLSPATLPLLKQITEVLAEWYALLRPHGFPFAYRVRDEVLCYCANSFDRDGVGLFEENIHTNLQIALDFQILQRVLPRLTGTRAQLETVLTEGTHLAERYRFSRTERRLSHLRERLLRDGFVHFDTI